MEVMKSEFEYFSPTILQSQVVRAYNREFTPVSSLQHGCPIEFAIPGTDLLYIDMAKSTLYIRAKITLPDGTVPAATVEIGPINNTLHSLFSNVEVELNGKVISDPNGMYAYRAYLESLLTYNPEIQGSQLQSAMWYKDTAGQMQQFNTVANSRNVGLVSRAEWFNNGVEVELSGRLHADIFHQPLMIMSNIPMRITLHLNRDNFVLLSPAHATNATIQYRMVITEARLYLATVEVTHSHALSIEHMLQKTNARLPIRRVTMKHLSIPIGQTSTLHDNIYLGALPERIVIGMVTDAAMSGGYHQNPFNFQHFGVNYLALYVNGELIPNKPYQPDFANNRYIRGYNSLSTGMGIDFSDKAICIDRREYAQGYTLWVFDLTADHNNTASKGAPKSGSVRIELKFAGATTQTVSVICYAEFDTMLEIDKYRNIITAF